MRVALTGASGFTGRFVAQALKDAGVECVPLSADLTDANMVDRIVADTPFDRLVHLAAKAFVDADDWQGFYTVNQLGTFHLLDAVARHRRGTRCIIASSAQVYGAGAEGLVTEHAALNPANHYAVSKAAMEQGAALWRDRLDLVVTRPFNYTGVGQDEAYLVPKLVRHFRCRAPVIELGNTWVKRDFGDVRSVADAYAGLVLSDAPCPIVNLATGVLSSIDDILSILAELSGHAIEVRVNPAFVRRNDVPVLGGDATLLRCVVPNWRPCPLRETLTWMFGAED